MKNKGSPIQLNFSLLEPSNRNTPITATDSDGRIHIQHNIFMYHDTPSLAPGQEDDVAPPLTWYQTVGMLDNLVSIFLQSPPPIGNKCMQYITEALHEAYRKKYPTIQDPLGDYIENILQWDVTGYWN